MVVGLITHVLFWPLGIKTFIVWPWMGSVLCFFSKAKINVSLSSLRNHFFQFSVSMKRAAKKVHSISKQLIYSIWLALFTWNGLHRNQIWRLAFEVSKSVLHFTFLRVKLFLWILKSNKKRSMFRVSFIVGFQSFSPKLNNGM